ncbi:MAG: ATP-binding protein [Saprospiraceae bacterium]
MRLCLSFLICLIGFCGLTFHAEAQGEFIQAEHYGIEDGLPHREVNGICEDHEGFIWIGTKEGLCRFDGYEFVPFPASRYGFLGDNFFDILEDSQGFLWLIPPMSATDFDIWNPRTGERTTFLEKFSAYKLPKLENLNISTNSKGEIYLIEPEGTNIWHYDPGSGLVKIPAPKGVSSIIHVSDFVWGINLPEQKAVKADKSGNILKTYPLNTSGISKTLRIVRFDPCLFYLNTINKSEIATCFLIQNGELTNLFNTNSKDYFPLQDLWGQSDSTLLWHSGKIINQAKKQVYELDDKSINLDKNFGRGHCLAKNHTLWVGANFGLYKLSFKTKRFHNLLTKPGSIQYGGNAVRSIDKDDNNLYCQLEVKGLHRINLNTGIATQIFKETQSSYYIAVKVLRDGNIAVNLGTQVKLIDPNGKILNSTRQPGAIVWNIEEAADGNIWIGTENGFGKYSFNEGFLFKSSADERFKALENAFVYRFREDGDNLYLSTSKGYFLVNLNKGIVERFWQEGENKYRLPADIVYHDYVDEHQSIWLGTNKGLFRLWPKGDGSDQNPYLEHYDRVDGLSNNVIYAVYPDSVGNLWLSSDYGIMRFDTKSKNVTTYLEQDGICNNEFNRTSHFQDSDGRIYFGSINGISDFHPRELRTKDYINPRLAITYFEQFDGSTNKMMDRFIELCSTNTITVKPSDRIFKIEFSLLTYDKPEKNFYAYKIEGVDKDWIYQKEHTLRFANLTFGNHILRIKGQDASGKWSENELAINLRVLKPFYLQTWFILLILLLITAAIMGYVRYHTYSLKQRNRTLEERVQTRTATIAEQAEELRKLDKLKSRFFANVSHELRTPLTLLLGPLENFIKKGAWKTKDMMLLQMMQRNGKLLLKLVNEILDLSKLETGKIELIETPVKLLEFFKPLSAQFSSFGDSERVHFNMHFKLPRETTLMLDKDKYEKIINNFLSNAIKFTPVGGHVDLTVEKEKDDLLVTVLDTGPGIHAKDLPYIFDRFYQSNQPDAITQGGTGIGLSLCKELSQLMGGEVWVDSKYGSGSKFYLRIPFKKAKNLPSPEQEEFTVDLENQHEESKNGLMPAASPDIENDRRSQILIVEDNLDLQQFMQSFLDNKYTIVCAGNGKEGLDKLLEGLRPDLIISDVMMPIMDGITMLEMVKEKDYLRHIPFIMLTARSDIKVKLRSLKLGVDDYMLKPFVEEELMARIKNLLENSRNRSGRRKATLSLDHDIESQPKGSLEVLITEEDSIWLQELEEIVNKSLHHFNFNSDYLAAQLNMSSRHLQRRVKTTTGLTLNHYIQEARLQQARELLESGNALVKQVAAQVGFKDTKHFTKLYKSRFGILPSEV